MNITELCIGNWVEDKNSAHPCESRKIVSIYYETIYWNTPDSPSCTSHISQIKPIKINENNICKYIIDEYGGDFKQEMNIYVFDNYKFRLTSDGIEMCDTDLRDNFARPGIYHIFHQLQNFLTLISHAI